MDQYEIRIVQKGKAVRVLASLQAGDYAAIRRGRALAKTCEGFEVWRADVCVFTQPESFHAHI